jgi:hypothetical protein
LKWVSGARQALLGHITSCLNDLSALQSYEPFLSRLREELTRDTPCDFENAINTFRKDAKIKKIIPSKASSILSKLLDLHHNFTKVHEIVPVWEAFHTEYKNTGNWLIVARKSPRRGSGKGSNFFPGKQIELLDFDDDDSSGSDDSSFAIEVNPLEVGSDSDDLRMETVFLNASRTGVEDELLTQQQVDEFEMAQREIFRRRFEERKRQYLNDQAIIRAQIAAKERIRLFREQHASLLLRHNASTVRKSVDLIADRDDALNTLEELKNPLDIRGDEGVMQKLKEENEKIAELEEDFNELGKIWLEVQQIGDAGRLGMRHLVESGKLVNQARRKNLTARIAKDLLVKYQEILKDGRVSTTRHYGALNRALSDL